MSENPHDREASQASDGLDLPSVEDASEPDAVVEQTVSEDRADELLLDSAARSLNGPEVAAAPSLADAPSTEAALVTGDADSGDLAGLPEAAEPYVQRPRRKGDWECELSAHHVALELKRIEDEIRTVLEDRDPKRKRKLSGTHRWHELEEDLISLHYSGRIQEPEVIRLRELVRRRHYLFRHLRFLASTRPTWNS